MRKHLLIIGVTLLACQQLFAQVDPTIENQILDYKPVKPELITKGRIMLADIFPDSDKEKALELVNYFRNEIETTGYLVFTSSERILLGFWTGDYKRQLDDITNPASGYVTNHYTDKYFAGLDNLTTVIAVATLRKLDSLALNVRASSLLHEDEKEFLCLYLKKEFMDNKESGITKDSISREAEIFVNNYPDSKYIPLVQKYILPKPAVFGGGLNISPIACNVLTGSLSENFQNSYGLGFGGEIYLKRAVLYGNFSWNFSRIRKDIALADDSLAWESGEDARLFLVDASLGYLILDKKRVALAPFAGIGYTCFYPSRDSEKQNEELEGFKINSHAYTAGVCLEFNLGKEGGSYDSQTHKKDSGYIRIRYTCFLPQFQRRYDNYDGVMNNITIAIGGYSRPGGKKMVPQNL